MKVFDEPLTFEEGDVLDPPQLNEAWNYASDAVADVATKRWTKAPLTFPFAGLTEASGDLLTFMFTCPVRCVIESAQLLANLVSSAAVKVNITRVSGGSTPDGCTVPWLRIDASASASEDATDLNANRVTLEAGQEYAITVSSTGTFTFTRFDVTLYLAIDRWNHATSTDIPEFNPAGYTDDTTRDADAVNLRNTQLATETAKFAAAKDSPVPVLFIAYDFDNATSANLRTFSMPQHAAARAQAVAKQLYVSAVMASTGGGTVTATLNDSGASFVASASANVAGVLAASGDSGAFTEDVNQGTPEDDSDDYDLVFAASNAVNALRAHALLWVARV